MHLEVSLRVREKEAGRGKDSSSLRGLSGGGNDMERRRRLLFHSASHNARVLRICESRSSGSKPVEAALRMGSRFHRMKMGVFLLFN